MKRIYFDYAASTPVDPEVEKAMRPYFGKIYANAAATHWFGQQASAAIFAARRKIAEALNCDYKEIVFTGSATEANNLALRGVLLGAVFNPLATVRSPSELAHWRARLARPALRGTMPARLASRARGSNTAPRIVTSAIEHESILETCRDLEARGLAEVIYVPVTKEGVVNVDKLKAALNEKTILVSVMYANNQIGTIQPIIEIAKIIRDFENPKSEIRNPKILFHTDAVQAFQFLKCDVKELGVDMLTLSGHKIYGPKGIGALYVKANPKSEIRNPKQTQNPKFKNFSNFEFRFSNFLQPQVTGGGQEWGLRSGTENTSNIVGFGRAVKITESLRVSEFKRLKQLRDYFWKNLKKIIPDAQLNGPSPSSKNYLPNILNIYFPGRPAQDLHIELDLLGLACSAGAACSARIPGPSYVIEALGFGDERSSSSLRFSLGRYTDTKEIKTAISILKKRFGK